jgi:hypothetical protein
MPPNFVTELEEFFLRVLFIEDNVITFMNTNRAKDMIRTPTKHAVFVIDSSIPTFKTKAEL